MRQSYEFAFTKLMVCGLCGSGISADEKYKELKDGTVAKYVYYGCGRSRDRHCKNPYLREEELVEQLVKIIDQVDLNQTGIQHRFEEELKRYRKFNRGVLGAKAEAPVHPDVDLRAYARYILRDGTNEEKRELMGRFKSKITVTRQVVTVA